MPGHDCAPDLVTTSSPAPGGSRDEIEGKTNMARQILLAACGLVALAACSQKSGQLLAETSPDAPTTEVSRPASATATPAAEAPVEGLADIPVGDYKIDPAHANLIFRVNHLGFSNYTARFAKFDASLHLDPSHPEAATLTATVDPASLDLPSPPAGFVAELTGDMFLDAKKFPQMTFKSTRIERVGQRRAHVTGDFTLHGVTKPVTLEITYNGGWAGIPQDPHARIGFSAHGKLNRSDFGVGYGVPAPGSHMGVSDEVDIAIEAEFTGPAQKQPSPEAPAAPH
jgi:polyisoprenoid-binding protein YceI